MRSPWFSPPKKTWNQASSLNSRTIEVMILSDVWSKKAWRRWPFDFILCMLRAYPEGAF